MHATREISCGLRARSKAAPLQASGTNTSCQRASAFEHEDEYEGRGTPFALIFLFGKAHALRYFWNTTVNTSSTLTLSARPSAGLSSVYFFYFWWGSNSF